MVGGCSCPYVENGQSLPETKTLPPSVRYLKQSLRVLDLQTNGINSVPDEIAALKGLQDMTLTW